MSKFTPGPWSRAICPHSKDSVFDKRGGFIAAVDMGFAITPEEREANANLISAAPEMYNLIILIQKLAFVAGNERLVSEIDKILAKIEGGDE